jgi:hypothetical protein
LGYWYVTGKVGAGYAQGLTVTLSSSDIPAINGMTAKVDQYGNFTFRFSSDYTGTIYLDTTDYWGMAAIEVSELLV